MYKFRACYINRFTGKQRIENITFDGDFYDSEKECYVFAMKRAYDLRRQKELLLTVECISN